MGLDTPFICGLRSKNPVHAVHTLRLGVRDYNMLPEVAKPASMSKEVTIEDIQESAEAVGDPNLLHLAKDVQSRVRVWDLAINMDHSRDKGRR